MGALIFGRTGQLARVLALRLPDATCFGREAADLSDPEACAARIAESRADWVINAAAYTDVDGAEDNEAQAFRVNAAAPAAMARAAAQRDIPFVTISTDYVFDGQGGAPYGPSSPPAPLNAYGRSKLAGEIAVAAEGGRYAIIRTGWLFSEGAANFVSSILRRAGEQDRIDVVADQIGGPTPARALAEAAIRIAERLGATPELSGIVHFSGAPDISRADFARKICQTAGFGTEIRDIATADFPNKARRPLDTRLDCSGFTRDIGLDRPDWQAALAQIAGRVGAGS